MVKKDKRRNKNFKAGELTKEAFKVLMHDLECLEMKDTEDNKYHYRLLKSNLADIFGISLENINIEDLE